jgi:Xaa-Pro aminopeptidase
METPVRIPRTEFAERRSRLMSALAERDIGGWITFGDDRAFAGGSHVRYLGDLCPTFEPVLLLGGAGGESMLLTGPESFGYTLLATEGTGIGSIAAMRELLHAGLEYKSVPLIDGVQTILDLLGGATRLGTLGWDKLPAHLVERIDAPLRAAGVDLIDVSDVAFALRSHKSVAEQAVLDRTFAIAARGMVAAAQIIRPGVTEREIAATADAAALEAGAEGFALDTMVSSGVAHTRRVLARSTFRAIERDDLVTVTLLPRYEGYHAALARPFLMAADERLQRVIETARSAQTAARDELRAGSEGRTATAACIDALGELRAEAQVADVWVHSTGLIEFEPPIFTDDVSETVAEGMAINLDVPLFEAPWGGLRIEDGFAIEHGRARPRIDGYAELVPTLL